MSNRAKIIEKAYKTYPILMRTDDDGMPYDAHADLQQGFIVGYEQAIKDIRAKFERQQYIPESIQKVIDDHFWEML